jgi:hypothetical protein
LQGQSTPTLSFSFANPVFQIGERTGNKYGLWTFDACGVLRGTLDTRDAPHFSDAMKSLDTFRWNRKVTYSIPRTSAAPPPIIMVAHASTTGNSIGITTPKVGNTLIASWQRPDSTTGTAPTGGGVTWTRVRETNLYAYTSIYAGYSASGQSSSISVPAGCTNLGITEFSGLSYSTASFDTAFGLIDGVGGGRMYTPTASLSSSIQVPYLMYMAVWAASDVAATGPSENWIALPSRVNTFDYLYRIGLSSKIEQYYGTVYSHGGGNVQTIAATFPGSIPTDVDYVKAPLVGSADVLKVGLAAPVGTPSAGTVSMIIRHRRT